MSVIWRYGIPVLAFVILVGCNPGGPDYKPTPPTYTLQGVVFDAYTGPVAKASVFARIGAGESYSASVEADSSGRFLLMNIPEGKLILWSSGRTQEFVQPCALAVDMRGDAVQDIETVSAETLNSLAPPRPLSVRPPVVTGTVYEVTATGRQPLAGASVTLTEFFYMRANTRTDLNGRYFICDVPAKNVQLSVSKAGYVDKSVGFDASTSTVDIEVVEGDNPGPFC